MKKWQEWAVVTFLIVVVVAVIGGSFYYLTKDIQTKPPVTEVEKSGEESALNEVDSELREVKDLELKELDAVEKDLESINLEGL